MAKVRIYEIAKELNVTNKEMTEELIKAGFNIKNHMSTLEESQVDWVKAHFAKQKKPAPAKKAPAAKGEGKPAATVKKTDEKKTETLKAAKTPEVADKTNKNDKGEKKPSPVKKAPAEAAQNRQQRPAAPQNGQNKRPNGGKPQGTEGKTQDNNRQHNPAGRNNNPRRENNGRPDNRNGNRRPDQPRQNQGAPANRNNAETKTPNTDRRPARTPENTSSDNRNNNRNNNRAGNRNTGGDRNKDRNNNRSNDNRYQANNRDYSRQGKKPKHKKRKEDIVPVRPDSISIPENITVRELAEALHVQGAELVKKLFEMGTMTTVNQNIDFDTAEILAALYDVEVKHEISREEEILKDIVDSEESLEFRPPIVTVMGHVDHGKTSLLDKIRSANVVSGEAGGITQHIGAYQAKVNDNLITFIDTPGHEAFTAMRARGANLTDIVILVVAADDGVMPQTIEAISHIKAAKVPFLVALNKIDKPDIDPERVKQELTKYGIVPEEWGGDTIFVPVSAKTGQGLDNLMEMLLLIAEMNELKANPNRAAEGVVIEGRLDKGKGPVATVLVQKGTLNVGDFLICGVNWCKVRSMTSYNGKRITTAPPSTPVEITGWTDVPEAGEKVQAVDEKVAKEISTIRTTEKKLEEQKKVSRVSLDDFFKQMQDSGRAELNLIIKGDVQGSIEALSDSLIKLSTDEVKVKVIHSAVGAINETDVMLASASDAIILGFNVRPDVKARQFAEKEKIDVRLYRVIYEAIKDVREAMAGLLEPEHREKYLGQAEVRQVIKVPDVGNIAGAYVLEGKIQRNAQVRILRAGVIIYEGILSSLKRFKDDAKEVMEGYECGIGIKDFNDIKEGDIIEVYVIEDVPREL